MKDNNCTFEFWKVSVEEVKKLLLSINNDKLLGTDNLDGKLLTIIADDIATSCWGIIRISW